MLTIDCDSHPLLVGVWMAQSLWKTVWQCLLYIQEMFTKRHVQDAHSTLSVIAKTRKQSKCLPIEEWRNSLLHSNFKSTNYWYTWRRRILWLIRRQIWSRNWVIQFIGSSRAGKTNLWCGDHNSCLCCSVSTPLPQKGHKGIFWVMEMMFFYLKMGGGYIRKFNLLYT